MKSNTNIIIIDDIIQETDSRIIELEQQYNHVEIYHIHEKGLEAVYQKITQRNIVILEIQSESSVLDGCKVLAKIRKKTYLIPVILWSEADVTMETLGDFINHKAFAYVKKGASVKPLLKKIKEAEIYLNNSVEGMIEEWIEIRNRNQKYTNAPYLLTACGKSYTLEQLLYEIRQQTSVGKDFSKSMHMLTIDLLLRNIEKLKE